MPKGLAAIILAKKKPNDGKESADDVGMKALAKDLISAVKDGNEKGVVDSMKGLYSACQVAGDEED